MTKMRIGILGGTFDPIHMGHLILAEEAVWRLGLDKVIFVPTYLPPHKEGAVVSAEHRYTMVTLAIEGNSRFEVSRIEIDAQAKSYSIQTIKKLKEQYKPDTEFVFIAGSDSLPELTSWKAIEDIFKLSQFAVATRPGFPLQGLPPEATSLAISEIGISSSEIRKRLSEKKGIRYLVPEAVRSYIKKNGLYK